MLSVLEPCRLGLDYYDGQPMMLPDCRCPWGCSEFSFATSHLNLAVLLQHLLSKVQLNMPSDWYNKLDSVKTMRLDYIRQSNEEDHCVLLNKSWPILPCMKFVPGKSMMVCTCRNHSDNSVRKRLYCHPPRKLNNNNLSSTHSCQLTVSTVRQNFARNVVRRGINTTPTSSYSDSQITGYSSGFVRLFQLLKHEGSHQMNHMHSVASLCRSDLKQVLACHVRDRKFTDTYAKVLLDDNKTQFTPEVLENLMLTCCYEVPTAVGFRQWHRLDLTSVRILNYCIDTGLICLPNSIAQY